MKISIRKTFSILIFFCLFFLASYEGNFSGIVHLIFKHYDEVISIFFLVYILLNYKFILKKKNKMILAWLIFLAIGWVSSLIYHYQDLSVALMDMIVVINKFMSGYLFAYIFFWKHQNLGISVIDRTAKVITVVLFILSIHDLFMSPFYPKGDYRYFMYSLRLMFTHPTYLASAALTLLFYFGYKSDERQNIKYMIIASLIAFFTLRSKTIGFLFIYWALYIYLFAMKKKSYKVPIIMGIPAVVFIGSEQISDYFLTTSYSPRLILLKDSIKLAKDSILIGRGYGTFGSPLAAQFYSPLYSSLGYSNNWGMSMDFSGFLNDSFWPIIIAQFGFLGFLIFLYIIYCFLKTGTKMFLENKYAGFTLIIIVINMLINSLGESSFFNQSSFLIFIIFGAIEAENSRVNIKL